MVVDPLVAVFVGLLVAVVVGPLVVVVVHRRRLFSFFIYVAIEKKEMFFFVLLLEMASKDNGESRHMIVAKAEKEAGYAIVAKSKEVVEAGSATVT